MDTFTRISVQKAHEIIGTGNAVTIVDVRDANSFAEGHIVQAQILSDENIGAFLQETNKEVPLICYCYHGISSQRAALFLLIKDSSRFTALMGAGRNGRRFMVKYLLNFLFVFLMLSSFSFAKNDDAKLKNEFGPDLTHAPYFLRFAFQKDFNKDWEKSYYSERKAFLTNYETNLASQKAIEKAEARAAADKERDLLREKKEALRRVRNKLRAQEAEARAQQREYDQRQKAFNDLIKKQQEELQQRQ